MAQHSDILSEERLVEWVDAFFEALGREPFAGVRRMRMARVRELNRLPDGALRSIGVSRELIPVFVFADLFCDPAGLKRD